MLESYFRLREHGTTVATEVVAGFTTFMVMAYIIFVNPAILSFAGIPALQSQGVPFAPTLAATCLVAALATALMGLVTNYPLAIASGMGLNAVVAFQLIAAQKLPWPAAMGVIFLEGVVITVLALSGIWFAGIGAWLVARRRRILGSATLAAVVVGVPAFWSLPHRGEQASGLNHAGLVPLAWCLALVVWLLVTPGREKRSS
jgi:AGZA family xanthine/uracil permease-like MFS transporter